MGICLKVNKGPPVTVVKNGSVETLVWIKNISDSTYPIIYLEHAASGEKKSAADKLADNLIDINCMGRK